MDPQEVGVDEFGPAKIIEVNEPAIGLRGVLVLDNLACGVAIGGLRMSSLATVAECARLARAMTLKNAMAGIPHGGGKSIIVGDSDVGRAMKESRIRCFAHALRGETDYLFGPDMGTDESAMAWVRDEIGRAVGLPEEIGGIPLDELGATAWGLVHAAEVAAPACGFALSGARVAIEGFGAVGRHAARFLAERGARIVAVSDSRAGVVDPHGLDPSRLAEAKSNGGSVADAGAGNRVPLEGVLGADCDILIPAARPDVIHDSNVDAVQARLILEGANIPITASAEARLARRGLTVIPDFVANAGGVICAAMEFARATREAAFEAIAETLRSNVAMVLERARRETVTPREAALRIAVGRVRKAMANRRWGIL